MTTAYQRARNLSHKRRRLRRHRGITGFIDGPTVAAHLTACIESGWTRLEIANESGVSDRAIRYILAGQPKVQRDNALRLLAVKPRQSHRTGTIGVIRRTRALARAGYPITWTAQQVGCSNRYIYEILNGTVTKINTRLAERFAEVYRRHEATPGPSAPARIAANAKGWPGPEAWDADTIDDPDAHPDWTGHCGTDHGWWLHRLEKIPGCRPCEQAHQQWKAERAHLSARELFAALGKAQAACRTREADLAHDARELFSYGLDTEQAAARLGVTRSHLQQALTRHPADREQQTAA